MLPDEKINLKPSDPISLLINKLREDLATVSVFFSLTECPSSARKQLLDDLEEAIRAARRVL